MTRKRIVLALLWAISLIIVGAFGHAQTIKQEQVIVPKIPPRTVLSGSDIGFSVKRKGTDHMEGILVVKVDGEWVPAEFSEKVY